MNLASTSLTNGSAKYDWGVYNKISNGYDQANLWRTLTKDEWDYVFNTRRTSSNDRFAKAMVNHVCGVILLPDDWKQSCYELANTNVPNADYSCNIISAANWIVLEANGATFLPAGGHRDGSSAKSVGVKGNYWSTSCNENRHALGVSFENDALETNAHLERYSGSSVRLVIDAQ
jgi:hypothetical protein